MMVNGMVSDTKHLEFRIVIPEEEMRDAQRLLSRNDPEPDAGKDEVFYWWTHEGEDYAFDIKLVNSRSGPYIDPILNGRVESDNLAYMEITPLEPAFSLDYGPAWEMEIDGITFSINVVKGV